MRILSVLTTCLLLLNWSSLTTAADYRCREGATPPTVHEGPRLLVGSLNIAHGRGQALNQMFVTKSGMEQNLDKASDLLSEVGADVLALQELDVDSLWSGNFHHANYILRRSTYECMAVGIHANNWLYNFGTGLLSETQLSDTAAVSFEPTPPTTTKGMTAGTVLWGNGKWVRPVLVVSVHLDFSRKEARKKQLRELIKAIQESEEAIVIMGDFNEEWDNEESVVQILVNEGGMKAYQPESPDYASYKDKRLDWILISSELQFTGYRVFQEEVSDHRLIVAELRWSDSE